MNEVVNKNFGHVFKQLRLRCWDSKDFLEGILRLRRKLMLLFLPVEVRRHLWPPFPPCSTLLVPLCSLHFGLFWSLRGDAAGWWSHWSPRCSTLGLLHSEVAHDSIPEERFINKHHYTLEDPVVSTSCPCIVVRLEKQIQDHSNRKLTCKNSQLTPTGSFCLLEGFLGGSLRGVFPFLGENDPLFSASFANVATRLTKWRWPILHNTAQR